MERLPKTQGGFGERINNEQNRRIRKIYILTAVMLAALMAAVGMVTVRCLTYGSSTIEYFQTISVEGANINVEDVPEYSGRPYMIINDNSPKLVSEVEDPTTAFEYYSDLDNLGRCGVAFANICMELMPTDEREDISEVYPSGWNNQRYEEIDQEYLYNRCHLIGFQLAGENANERNLITGTRYFNIEGMLPFENEVREYVISTHNHVLYRVTPIYDGNNLVASGIVLEAWSVEDAGEGISFEVYIYNVQPGIYIDYSTGENHKLI